MAEQPDMYVNHVVAQLQYWTQRKAHLQEANQRLRDKLPLDKQATVGKIDILLLEEMRVYSGHMDTEYIVDMVNGFPVTGSMSSGGCGL